MNRRIAVLLVGTLLFTLPALAIINDNTIRLGQILGSEKCSLQIEDLKLCAENSKITVNSGEPVKIKVSWVNSSNIDRRIGTYSSGYKVIIIDQKGEKLIPVFLQRQMERQQRVNSSGDRTMTEEDINEFRRTVRGGSDRGIYVEANQTENDEIKLTEVMYDYDLTNRGKYIVTISKAVASLQGEKAIEFVIENIEIEVR